MGLLLAHGFFLLFFNYYCYFSPPLHFSFNFLEALGLLHCLVYGSVCGAEVSLNRFRTRENPEEISLKLEKAVAVNVGNDCQRLIYAV